ncbi:unnamed protein product [Moneuplotes crassus]|uniref:Uncharacterized protein n=1 Tax=Euplotes crassus TaxID=5936 RepID=A0AAD1U3L5_EUPCR|nr:unnamed protein product [Moneuplotes crassus]
MKSYSTQTLPKTPKHPLEFLLQSIHLSGLNCFKINQSSSKSTSIKICKNSISLFPSLPLSIPPAPQSLNSYHLNHSPSYSFKCFRAHFSVRFLSFTDS